ncbi:SixA phosphatase family protein, partial [Rhodopseudomonas palustris]
MRRLILLRHAKTETDAPSGKDRDRRLDERGRADAAGIGDWLLRHHLLPEQVQVSTAVRAQQTWEIVAATLAEALPKPAVSHLPELYVAGPQALLQAIRDAQDLPRLLVVGHNPGLHELALAMICDGATADRNALSR